MKRLIRQAVSAARGKPRSGMYREYARLQWHDRASLQVDQMRRIQSLVSHAAETTEFYGEALRSLGMTPQDINGVEDFSRLPVLTKDIIRDNTPQLISSAYGLEGSIKNNSGGSTGEPLVFYQNRGLFEEMQANLMLSLSFAGWQPGDDVVNIWGNPQEFRKKGGYLKQFKSWLSGTTLLNAYQYNRSVMKEWASTIRKHDRVFVYGYASVLADFAEYMMEQGISFPGVKGVMSSAEKLHGWQREQISKAFGCPVYDQYGSREVQSIASECEAGNMHLFTHSAFVEFEPEQGSDRQKVIVTSLTNRAMPFIRYDIGDYAAPMDGVCSCGRGFPLMKMDIGRTCDSFVMPSGDTIYGTYFVRQMYGIEGVSSFQFHQTEPETVRLRIVRGAAFSDDSQSMVDAIEGRIQSEITPAISLDIMYVDEIPKTSGGKHRHVICEVKR